MLNAIGLQNPGVDHVVRSILPTLDFSETRFIANVCGSTIEEYVEVTRRFDDSPIDAIEINISCPNIKEGGVQFGNVPEMSARVVAACRRVTRKPLITKLSPNQTDIRENARALHRSRHRCFRGHQYRDRHGDRHRHAPAGARQRPGRPLGPGDQADRAAQGAGSLRSRRPDSAFRSSARAASPARSDALEFIIAGASAVGVGTALFYDPLVCARASTPGIAAISRRAGLELGDAAGRHAGYGRARRRRRLLIWPHEHRRRTRAAAGLRDRGAISDEEFARAKAQVLDETATLAHRHRTAHSCISLRARAATASSAGCAADWASTPTCRPGPGA